jgi:hypothetical protein
MSVGFVSGASVCQEHQVSAATNNHFFAKRERLEKARHVLYNVLLLSFEAGTNSAHARTLPALPGPGRADLQVLLVL